MDLIEVLWKQDVDLGFTLVDQTPAKPASTSTSEKNSADDLEKLKALEAINATKNEVRLFFYNFHLLKILQNAEENSKQRLTEISSNCDRIE